eukprot:2672973-Pyramimonas_sp.AAC.1
MTFSSACTRTSLATPRVSWSSGRKRLTGPLPEKPGGNPARALPRAALPSRPGAVAQEPLPHRLPTRA